MLERLAGPFPVTDLATGLTLNGADFGLDHVWLDPDGLLFEHPLGNYLVQMDGTACRVGDRLGFRNMGQSLLDANALDAKSGDPWASFHLYGIDGTVATEHIVDRVFHSTGPLIRTDHPATTFSQYATVHDRWLTLNGSTVRVSTGGAYSVERTITGFAGAGKSGCSFSWARERGRMWLGSNDGRVVQYDFDDKIETSLVFRTSLTSAAAMCYSKKHNVFVSMHTDGTSYVMNVWSRRPLPASLTAVTALTTVAPGRASTVRTQVLGSEGEPCAGEVVSWSVAAQGTLALTASASDADGYATNVLTLPIAAAGPNTVVTVGVVIP